MKPSAIFIIIGRGMTTRLDDLNDALRNGVIAANPSLYPELFRLVAERRR